MLELLSTVPLRSTSACPRETAPGGLSTFIRVTTTLEAANAHVGGRMTRTRTRRGVVAGAGAVPLLPPKSSSCVRVLTHAYAGIASGMTMSQSRSRSLEDSRGRGDEGSGGGVAKGTVI